MCDNCGIHPKSPGLFTVYHEKKTGYSTNRYTRLLCARCIPCRLTFPGFIRTVAVR